MTTPKQIAEVTIKFKMLVVDTSLPATMSNVTPSQADVIINGVEMPNWNEQQLVTGSETMPKWVAVSASLRNELQTFLQTYGAERLFALGLVEA